MRTKKISRLAAALLCVMLILSGCGVTDNTNNELTVSYEISDDLLVYPDGYKVTSTSAPEIDGYTLCLENDDLALYIGTNYDIIVYEKATGEYTYSNQVFTDLSESEVNALSSQTRAVECSQVSITYYTTSLTKKTMSSYPDAVSASKDQVTWEVDGDTLTVTYGLGTNNEDSVIIQIMTQDTYNYYMEQLDALVEAGEISKIDERVWKNRYIEVAYSALSNSDKKEYKENYPNIEELGTVYILSSSTTSSEYDKLRALYALLGIDESVKVAENEALGGEAASSGDAYFVIPVTYQLSGNDLIVSVDLESIQVSEGFYLTQVSLLPCFGATTSDQEGYMFVPDGSGSIIENDFNANSQYSVTLNFYGAEQSRSMSENTSSTMDNTLPVFGIKGDDHSVFAVVESGAAIGGVTAQLNNSYLSYNMVYTWFNYEIVDTYGVEGISYAFYDIIPDTTYAVRYHFLNGDESDYSGMANYYQQYLVQKGVLTKQESSDDDTLAMDIELIGVIDKTVNYAGIPVDQKYAVTTIEQAEEIVDILKEGGIEDFDLLYTGVINGGMTQKALNKVRLVSTIGSLSDYVELNTTLAEEDVSLYTGMDPVRIYDTGNGVAAREDVVKDLTKSTVMIGATDVATGSYYDGLVGYLINPLRYAQIAQNFVSAAEKLQNNKLYLESIGAYLSGNYSQEQGVTRVTAQELTVEMLETITDAGYELKLDVGNDYVLQYASSLTNVATSSSHQRLESYSIPFVGMVLKGYITYTTEALNQSSNETQSLLEAIESGAGLNYLLMYDDQLNLQDTDFDQLFSVNYKLNTDTIISTWTQLNEDLGYLQNVAIERHDHLTEDVNCVTYEDGSKIYVNYGETDYDTGEGIVEAMSYLVVRG